MKKIAVFMFLCSCAAGRSKNSENKSKLEGKWQLSAMFLQTSGPGSWHVQGTQ